MAVPPAPGSYAEATGFLYGLTPRGVRLGLSRMRRACALRGHPERAVPVIHVAGTNGKGGTVAVLEAVLRAAGYRTGAFTSPHLHQLTERFRIAGKPITQRALAGRALELREWLARRGTPRLTFFEASSLIAFEAFRDAGCDIALIEVGLGGRLDSTNVVMPEVSVVTHIGRDHEDRLGRGVARIAVEKAGIIKRGRPVVVGVRSPVAFRAIDEIASARRAPLMRIGRDFSAVAVHRDEDGALQLRAGGARLDRVKPSLPGPHSDDQAALVFAVVHQLRARGWDVPDTAVRRGIGRARWPGRLEWVSSEPRVLLDAGHNLDGTRTLATYLRTEPRPRGKRVLLFGAMADKRVAPMLGALDSLFDARVFTRPPGDRSWDPARRTQKQGDLVEPDFRAALAMAQRTAGRNGEVVVAGSIFVMAPIRAALLGLRTEPALRM